MRMECNGHSNELIADGSGNFRIDDNGTEAVAMEQAGLIDLNDPDQVEKVETYVEVTAIASEIFEEKMALLEIERNSNYVEEEEQQRKLEEQARQEAAFLEMMKQEKKNLEI